MCACACVYVSMCVCVRGHAKEFFPNLSGDKRLNLRTHISSLACKQAECIHSYQQLCNFACERAKVRAPTSAALQ